MSKGRKTYFRTEYYRDICNSYKAYIENHLLLLYKPGSRTQNQVIAFDFARLLFPIIDSFNPLYKKVHRIKGNKIKSRALLLAKLKVKNPYLIWHLYRDKIIHNDYFGLTIYLNNLIVPQWSMDDPGITYFDEYLSSSIERPYSIGNNILNIDTEITLNLNPYLLAKDFTSFLEKEASNYGNIKVKKEYATKFFSKGAKKYGPKNKKIIDEINEIIGILNN